MERGYGCYVDLGFILISGHHVECPLGTINNKGNCDYNTMPLRNWFFHKLTHTQQADVLRSYGVRPVLVSVP